MNKYVSPIIEIENVEVEDIILSDENETEGAVGGGGGIPVIKPTNPGGGGSGGGNVTFPTMPTSLNQYFNK